MQGDDVLREAVLNLLTTPFSPAAAVSSPRRHKVSAEKSVVSSFPELARVESLMWALLSGNGYSLNMTVPVSRAEAAECLRHVKAVLVDVEWSRREEALRKGIDKGFSSSPSAVPQTSQIGQLEGSSELSDIDELMTTLQLFSVSCKTIILAYNALEKSQKTEALEFQSLNDLFNSLAPGTASDLANGLLGAIAHCSYRWRRRYERSFEVSGAREDSARMVSEVNRIMDGQQNGKNHDRISSIRSARQLKAMERWRFINSTSAEVPGVTLFAALCKHIPSYTADVLLKCVEPPEQPTVVTPSTSSWSLWGSR